MGPVSLTSGGKVNERTTPILLESGRKGDSEDGAGVHVEIKEEPHTRRRDLGETIDQEQ